MAHQLINITIYVYAIVGENIIYDNVCPEQQNTALK